MTYHSNNLDEDFIRIQKFEPPEVYELYSGLHDEFRKLEPPTVQSQHLDLPPKSGMNPSKSSKKRNLFLLIALIAFSSSVMFLSVLLLGIANSSKFPLTYTVAFFISFATAIALYAESKSVTVRKKGS